MSAIAEVNARQILDSRGNPTVEVEVELIETEVAQVSLAGGANMIGVMVGVPKLRGDPEIISGARSRCHGPFQTRTDGLFISIVAGTVKMPVAQIYGGRDEVGKNGIRYFPCSEADRGKLAAVSGDNVFEGFAHTGKTYKVIPFESSPVISFRTPVKIS